MDNQNEGIEVVIGAGSHVNFHTFEECDAWIANHRELHPDELIRIRVQFSPDVAFKRMAYNELINRWDWVKDNLALTIEDASIYPKEILQVPNRTCLNGCEVWLPNASRAETYLRPKNSFEARWSRGDPSLRTIADAVRTTFLR